MIINDLLEKKKMSRYMLAIKAEIPQSTILDICSGKANLNDCKAGTLHKIAKVLNVTTDYILDEFNKGNEDYRRIYQRP